MTEAMHLVLIVEDDPSLQSVLCTLFEANGYRVVAADVAVGADLGDCLSRSSSRHGRTVERTKKKRGLRKPRRAISLCGLTRRAKTLDEWGTVSFFVGRL